MTNVQVFSLESREAQLNWLRVSHTLLSLAADNLKSTQKLDSLHSQLLNM